MIKHCFQRGSTAVDNSAINQPLTQKLCRARLQNHA